MPEESSKEPRILSVFIELRRKLAQSVLGIVPPREVEDIVQETYVRACQMDERAVMVRPKALLYKVARNLALDYAKRAETRLVRTDDSDSIDVLASSLRSNNELLDNAITQERFADLCVAVRRLPQQRRRAFVLKKVYGYTQREIAREMQISEKTVENYIGKATQACYEYLNRYGEEASENASRKRSGRAEWRIHEKSEAE